MSACKIVTSWPTDSGIGSGVVAVASSLRRVLEQGGFDAELLSADFPSSGYFATSARRVLFNLRLRFLLGSHGGAPLVVFDFDGFALPPKTRFVLFNQGILGDIVRFESGAVRKALRLLAALENRAAHKAERIFVPSRWAAEKLGALYGVPLSRMQVMPNGLFLDEWRQLLDAATRIEKRPPTVLCVARLYRRKGVDRLIRVWPKIAAKIPDAVLRIAGDGLEAARLKDLVRRTRMERTVFFEGDVTSRAQLARLYANCDVFCLPSMHETFGIVFLEAMAAGKPVVAVNGAATPEVVRNGTDGVLVGPDDAELADAVCALLSDAAMRETMGQNGRNRVSAEFDWKNAARPLVEYLGKW
jgi:glycosyltransferase involved in cell wall biosynthesis